MTKPFFDFLNSKYVSKHSESILKTFGKKFCLPYFVIFSERNCYDGSNWGWVTGGCVTEQSIFWKNGSLYKFRKIAFIECFYFFRHFMHNYATKSSTFSKLGEFSLEYRNFTKFSEHPAPKMCHFGQFFPKFSIFRRLWRRKICHSKGERSPPPIWALIAML